MEGKFSEYFSEDQINKIFTLMNNMTNYPLKKSKNFVLTTENIRNGLDKYYESMVYNIDYIYDERTENMLNITKKIKDTKLFLWLILNDYYYSRPLYYIFIE
jgi:hypothetical protein